MNSYEVGVTVRFSWEAEDVDSEEEAIEEAMQALSENGGNPYEVFHRTSQRLRLAGASQLWVVGYGSRPYPAAHARTRART